MEEAQRLTYLLEVYGKKEATEKEQKELFDIIEGQGIPVIEQHLKRLLDSYSREDEVPQVDWERVFLHIQEDKLEKDSCEKPVEVEDHHHPHAVHRLFYLKWSAAALLLLFIGAGIYLFLKKTTVPFTDHDLVRVKSGEIVPPSSNRAILTLNNGQQLLVDSLGNGQLMVNAALHIDKTGDGALIIHGNEGAITMNQLTNPRGSKVLKVVLDDGTNVWLNAASTLNFPSRFVKGKREVRLDGEAYFEVAHDAHAPFFVKSGQMQVEVLGTHFNVSSYKDDSSIKVALLEGSIDVHCGQIQKIIKPGWQAEIDTNGLHPIHIQRMADPTAAIAWQNGQFVFQDQDIYTIMRQVARWYNVEVKYEDVIQDKFYAEVSRQTSIVTLLKMLEATKVVHFKIDNKTIIVMKGTG